MIKPRALSKIELFKRWKSEIVPLLNEVISAVNADWTEDDIEISINKNESVVFIVEKNNAIKALTVLTPRETFDTLELHCWATVVKPPLQLTEYWDWIKFHLKQAMMFLIFLRFLRKWLFWVEGLLPVNLASFCIV